MSILSGVIKEKVYKKIANGYKLISRYTDSSTVNMPDGNTATKNLGAIKGITSSLNATTPGFAADATSVATLNSNLGSVRFGVDADGNYGYKKVGADTVTPFKSKPKLIYHNDKNPGYSLTLDIKPFASNYAKLTVDNFIFEALSYGVLSATFYASASITKTYNQLTGTLIVNNLYYHNVHSVDSGVQMFIGACNVYLIM